jgi:predicted alpha/beta-fold hydrolase
MTQFNNTIEPFRPVWWAKGGHLQTILSYYLFPAPNLRFDEAHKITLDDTDTIVMLENRPHRTPQGVILLMHGLGSDAEAPYIRRLVPQFLKNNWIVLRINHRGAGSGEGLAKNLYHSGRSEDVSAALIKAAEIYPDLPLYAVGFSLSGNMLLKLLGEQAQPVPANLKAAIVVNPPIDLSMCARALLRKSNMIYDIRFVRLLKKAMQQRMIDFPDFPKVPLEKVRTLYDFDEQITAPLNGFSSAEDYYAKCHAKQFLGKISIPTLIIASDDDPFIPKATFDNLPENQHLHFILTRSGGHVGFVHARKSTLGNRRWLEYAILEYAQHAIK